MLIFRILNSNNILSVESMGNSVQLIVVWTKRWQTCRKILQSCIHRGLRTSEGSLGHSRTWITRPRCGLIYGTPVRRLFGARHYIRLAQQDIHLASRSLGGLPVLQRERQAPNHWLDSEESAREDHFIGS